MSDDEQFFAWLDGELGAEDAARVEARVAADPRLGALADQHRAMQARLGQAFGSILDAPMPERLLVGAGAKILPFRTAKPSRPANPWHFKMRWAAMAATFAIGVLAGTVVPQRASGPVEVASGGLYAAAALEEALETQLASAPAGDVRVGLTFRDRTGVICRSFTQPHASGLACRAGERWRLRGLFAAPEGQAGEFRMAAGVDPNLAALIDTTIIGDPLDQAQERAARQSHWR